MSEMKIASEFLQQSIAVFQSSKALADRTFTQLNYEELTWKPNEESNSISMIVKHMHGNMLSRWTDFLTTDGEKPWRNRDQEFIGDYPDRDSILQAWEEGWRCVWNALESLQEEDCLRTITIRGEEHTVIQAIHRQISHYSYHIGQIVYLGKQLKNYEWHTLSIARGKSQEYLEEKLKDHQEEK